MKLKDILNSRLSLLRDILHTNRYNPVFLCETTGKWHFWDEVWLEKHGPYNCQRDAMNAIIEYARNL